MPSTQTHNKLSPFVRTLLIWFIIIGLALVWQATKSSTNTNSSQQISYLEFLRQADKHNIATATLVLSQNMAEVRGNLREPAREYRTTVPRASASDLTEPLRNVGVNVKVSQMPAWTSELLNFAPPADSRRLVDIHHGDEADTREASASAKFIECSSREYSAVRKGSK